MVREEGWLRSNPIADVAPDGQRNRGKKQLRIDEARKLVDLCIAKANAGDDAAVGVRDLDDGERLLWIEFGKTMRSRRTLEVPALLRPYLLARAASPCAYTSLRSFPSNFGLRAPDQNLFRTRSCALKASNVPLSSPACSGAPRAELRDVKPLRTQRVGSHPPAMPTCCMNASLSQNSHSMSITPFVQCPTVHIGILNALPVGWMVLPSSASAP